MGRIIAVGSVAYDTIWTAQTKVERTLGGSAVHFSLAASLLSPVSIISCVGEDFEHFAFISRQNVDITRVEVIPGAKTFNWEGSYIDNPETPVSLRTDIGAFTQFKPVLNDDEKNTRFIFLGNIDPVLQLSVIDQLSEDHDHIIAMDTMNYWLDSAYDKVLEAVSKVGILFINEHELALLLKKPFNIENTQAFMHEHPNLGVIVIKRGGSGCVIMSKGNPDVLIPAKMLSRIVDPTGAGDTFAGGFMGYLARSSQYTYGNSLFSLENLKRAAVFATVCAACAVSSTGCSAFIADRRNMVSIAQKVRAFLHQSQLSEPVLPC